MRVNTHDILPTAEALTESFLLNYPDKAAMRIAAQPFKSMLEVLTPQKASVVAAIMKHLPAGSLDRFVAELSVERVASIFAVLEPQYAVHLILRQNDEWQKKFLNHLLETMPRLHQEFEELMQYPEGSVGRLMNPVVQALPQGASIADCVSMLKRRKVDFLEVLFIVDLDNRVRAEVALSKMLLADKNQSIDSVSDPVKTVLNAFDQGDEVLDNLDLVEVKALPVVNMLGQLIGVLSAKSLYQRTREELVADIQSMVGVSREERALSSPWFAVKKRLPWLQINLVTAFVAAAVVGAFENLIAQYTALAILLPVAAGQSGNAGAQALAVTMRGLTLHEITARNWFAVFMKESFAGLINGVAIALTCALGVYIWSRSWGLSLIMALAMISSLVIACAAGALVPIALKRLGMDPAQSSSIVLTTVTDIAGFMSFLGIATLLAFTLVL